MTDDADKLDEVVEVRDLETEELKQKDSGKPAPNRDINMNMILDIPVNVHVELGSTEASIREILKMGPGSIVELDREAGAPADLIVNGKLIGQGDIVVVGDNFGIRISSLVDPEQRIESL